MLCYLHLMECFRPSTVRVGTVDKKVVSPPSLDRVKQRFPHCVEARLSTSTPPSGKVTQDKCNVLLLSFKERAHAIVARLQLQEERAKGTDWRNVQYARRVVNLFDREK